MEYLNNLLFGFQIVLQPMNLLYCFIGVFIGTLIGVLPGIGPTGTIALLLPSTFYLPPTSAIIMLAGIYYGAQYGGSTTSILVNIPGEASSVVTCLDGYQMARKGRAGPALGIAAFGSLIGGTFSIIGLMMLAVPLARFALRFGPSEYFSIMCLGLVLVSYLARGSIIKALAMGVLGIIISFIGMDEITGKIRFNLGLMELTDGIDLIPLVMGLFGISEVLLNLEEKSEMGIYKEKIRGLLPSVKDWIDSIGAIVRGSIMGFFIGIIPGGGTIISSFVSYAFEKKISKHPERFGTGAIQGVAGPETANNAATGGAFIPLFSLGIPSNAVTALLLGALMIHGIEPGPLLLQKHPDVFWGTVASMYIGNVILLALNLPLIPMWVRVLKIPYRILFPLIILFCLIGSYSVNNKVSDMVIMVIFGILGYFLRKCEFELAPLVLAFVLGPMLETSLRQSLIISHGSFLIFFTRPIAVICLLLSLLLLTMSYMPFLRRHTKFKSLDSD